MYNMTVREIGKKIETYLSIQKKKKEIQNRWPTLKIVTLLVYIKGVST